MTTKCLALLLFCCGMARVARADDAHYQDFLVGARAIGLGGAFAAIANDPSGLYYNPAGIVDASRTNLQLSTSLYGFERGSIPEGLITPVPGVDELRLEFTDLIIIPASAGFVKAFGDHDEIGRPNQAYGLSIVVPSYRSFIAGSDADPQGVQNLYQRRVTDRELWTGLGASKRISPRLRLGVSGYYILRSVSDREDLLTSEQGAEQNRFQVVTNDITFINGAFVLTVGALYDVTNNFALGFSLRPPSLPVHSQARMSFIRATAGATPDSSPSLENFAIDGKSKQALAPTVRLGASYARAYKYTFSADATYHAPVSYDLMRPKAKDRAAFESFSGRLPFSPHVRREQVLNVGAGAEFLIVREVSLAGGVFTDFSSSPKIAAVPTHDQPPDVDLIGMSMSVGYFGAHTLSRLGVMYSFGTGHDVIPESDLDRLTSGAQTFRRVEYFQSFFYVFLSSTFRY